MISDKEALGKVEINSEDLLKGMFSFKKPLTSRYRKKYVEVLALSVLQYCYGDIYAGFDVHDAPDISDENRLIGIEVTEAVTKEEAQIEGEFVKYCLESSLEEKERRKQIIENDSKRQALNSLAHSEIKQRVEKIVSQFNGKKIFCEIPLIVESNMVDYFDEIWCVVADNNVRINRIVARDKVSELDAKIVNVDTNKASVKEY